MKASHVYIHIPYCRKKCSYCNFFSAMNAKEMPNMAGYIMDELDLRKMDLSPNLRTIYFGGGTPSLLPASDIEKIISKLASISQIDHSTEITIEINPEDASIKKINDWKRSGINRFSVGIQSLNNDLLHVLGRNHDATEGVTAVKLLQHAGIENISVDFIFGLPQENLKDLMKNLQFVTDFSIPPLSAYSLTIEEKTLLQNKIRKGIFASPDEEQNAHFYELIMNWAAVNKYNHYEISNFAKPGFESMHNKSYWNGSEYMGLGPGAHSYGDGIRSWNVESIDRYKNGIISHARDFGFEQLSLTQKLNESIINKTRTALGIDLLIFENEFGSDETRALLYRAAKCEQLGLIVIGNQSIVLTREGRLMADFVSVELMKED